MSQYVPRQLSCHIDDEEVVIQDSSLLGLGRNIVVLAEAGMGKSQLLQHLNGCGGRYVSARRLLHAGDPREVVEQGMYALIDAVDELPGYKHGDALDALIGKLADSGCQNFVISCRVEDWRHATAGSLIEEFYGARPLEFTLRPFDEDQIRRFLAHQVGDKRSSEILSHYKAAIFADWLGNPQTLGMVAAVAETGDLPDTTAHLFSRYIDLAWNEENSNRRERSSRPSKEAVLDTLGAMSAAIIICGKEAVVKDKNSAPQDLISLVELQQLPAFGGWDTLEGNRLFKQVSVGEVRAFTFIHKRIGEWLGARWISRQASSSRLANRFLGNLVVKGIVPANIRGIFAWLSQYEHFAEQVLRTDPMAVIEYADADNLSPQQSAILLEALEDLAVRNPWFSYSGSFRARALISGHLREQSLATMLDTSAAMRLRLLIADQFESSALVDTELDPFRRLVLDPSEPSRLRESAATALLQSVGSAERTSIVESVLALGGVENSRIATSVILAADIENFSDELVAEAIMSAGGFGPTGPTQKDNLFGSFWRYRYDLPDSRIPSFLDALAVRAEARFPEYRDIESSEIRSLANRLIVRHLASNVEDPARLLGWLHVFAGIEGYHDDDGRIVGDFIQGHDEIRRSMQRQWLAEIDRPEKLRRAAFELRELHPSLLLSDDDFADFLSRLPRSYPHWEEIAWLVRHSGDEGIATRRAMRRFMETDAEFEEWQQKILNPSQPDWQVEQEQRQQQYALKRQERWTIFREDIAAEADALKSGQFGTLVQAARVYFGGFSDLHDLNTADERLDALIGTELKKGFFEGLENWLLKPPLEPNADTIAHDYAEDRAWNDRYIWLAAFNERVRQKGKIAPVHEDHLIIAQLHVTNHWADGDEWQDLREAIWGELTNSREAFARYAKLACERSLSKGAEFVSGLHDVIEDAKHQLPHVVETLSAQWLSRFWRMHWRPERELVAFHLEQKNEDLLRDLVKRRLAMTSLSEERRHTWQAVGVLVDFAAYAPQVAASLKVEPDLFWVLRDLLGGRRPHDDFPRAIPVELAGWLVEQGRRIFPLADRPGRVTVGDTNSWDASEAIKRLVSTIGSDNSAKGVEVLIDLAAVRDGYQNFLLSVLDEQKHRRAELEWRPLEVDQFSACISDKAPASLPDLQQEVLLLLNEAEAIVQSDDIDSWRGFFESDLRTPKKEEDCSDALIGVLRRLSSKVTFKPENHLGKDREGDIECTVGDLYVPIEAKGQWHRDLWTAIDDQLDAQQAIDYRAKGYGVYLVYWFGNDLDKKQLAGPPRNSGVKRPQTPQQLEEGLRKISKAALQGRIKIKVLDLSRD